VVEGERSDGSGISLVARFLLPARSPLLRVEVRIVHDYVGDGADAAVPQIPHDAGQPFAGDGGISAPPHVQDPYLAALVGSAVGEHVGREAEFRSEAEEGSRGGDELGIRSWIERGIAVVVVDGRAILEGNDGDRSAGPRERRLRQELIDRLPQALAGFRRSARRQGGQGGKPDGQRRWLPPGSPPLYFDSKQTNLARARSPACSIVPTAQATGNASETHQAGPCTSLDNRTGGKAVRFPQPSRFAPVDAPWAVPQHRDPGGFVVGDAATLEVWNWTSMRSPRAP